ncbi:BA14K family protein [Bradyrhizobium sediminis]|uniref:Lectin-like protein BA14k n=1 Tax=Bradyrhizobium sediminis TaxID=2840469 RepID=A0A975NBV9_9BRAD|nr:BA14K family protein [Bradyrhizobium sediminis]
MISKFTLTALLAIAVCAPVERAAAQGSTLGGAIFGGAAGAIVGGAIGGNSGAAVGAIIGAGTGAAIGAQGEPRPGGYRYYQNGCYVQQPDGSWMGVSPRYCQTVEYAPRERYYDEAPACTRYRSYNPRTGTFIGRDGYERPCP